MTDKLNKKNGLLNEFQTYLIFIDEKIDRLRYFDKLNSREYNMMKMMTQDFRNSVNKYINEIIIKNKK